MIFFIIEIVCLPIGTSSALRKKKTGKESQFIVSRPELCSDPPFGSDQESGYDSSFVITEEYLKSDLVVFVYLIQKRHSQDLSSQKRHSQGLSSQNSLREIS